MARYGAHLNAHELRTVVGQQPIAPVLPRRHRSATGQWLAAAGAPKPLDARDTR
eukprot:SAG31_NODE_29054_length_401_cov_1.188742_2_plen_53_part_01